MVQEMLEEMVEEMIQAMMRQTLADCKTLPGLLQAGLRATGSMEIR
jgi:hypothetical protein